MGKRYFSPITWLNLRRSTRKVTKWIEKLGSGISKMWIIFAPRSGHVIRDKAHAQWPFQVIVMWSDWVTDNRRKLLKLRISKYVWRIKLYSSDTAKVKRSKVEVTRSNENIVHKTSIICRKRHRIVEIYPSCRKSMSPERISGSDFWSEFPK